MSDIKDKFFGGEEKKAGKQAAKELERGREALSEKVGLGRKDLLSLYGGSRETLANAVSEALGLMNPAIRESSRLRGAGNVAAQQALIDAQKNAQNAILGFPTSPTSAPVEIAPDFSFMDTPRREYTPIAETLAPPEEQAAQSVQLPEIDFGRLLKQVP